jgi:poly-gamma-glutamate synthesis protein (capsule biosynthesis protein)
LLVPALAAVACTGTSKSDVTVAPTTTTTSAPTTTTAPIVTTTTRGPLGSGQPITIVFAGDINFEDDMGVRLAAHPATAIGPFTEVLRAADLAVGNLETALGTHGVAQDKQYVFRAPATAVDALRSGGFDVVSMANNHSLDYGLDGLADSLAIKDAQPDHFIVGIGHDDVDAFSPFLTTIKGQRIAVIGASQVYDDLFPPWPATPKRPGLASAKDVARVVRAVEEARPLADTVVVYLHWGVEKQSCPSADQQALARALADAGADIVIGGHSHRLQGAGFLGTTFVGYGLGNFDFYPDAPEAAKSGLVEVTVTGRNVDGYRFLPGQILASQARPLSGAAADAATAEWIAGRDCTNLTP